MKFLPTLICLFLSASLSTVPIDHLENQVKTVSSADAPSLSKKIRRTQDIWIRYQDYQEIVLHRHLADPETNPKTIRSDRQAIRACSRQLERLTDAQAILEKRFQAQYRDIKPGGQANMDRVIPGDHDLPSFGGIYRKQKPASDACLLEGDEDVGEYSLSWIPYIERGTISAGTWAYPSGGMHLGMDVAAPLMSRVVAGANGLILYADDPVPSNCGYLGNYCGWPYGGGNTICMLAAVNGKLYAVSLCHLSNQILVVPGQQVHQGDLLAYSGNSGNSTGPHTHIEVIELKTDAAQAAAYFRQGADFSFGCGWDTPAACSAIGCRVRPEEVF